MATISFHANIKANGGQEEISHTIGSGIGFYGSDFGVSVPIGSQQTTTFVTNDIGTDRGLALYNTAYANGDDVTLRPGKVISQKGATPHDLDELSNTYVPLNIRFTHDTPVKTQNCKLRIFDRNNIENHASGVVTYVYECRHPNNAESSVPLAHRAPGRSHDGWVVFESDGLGTPPEDMAFTSSPGMSGLNTVIEDTANAAFLASIFGANDQDYKQGASHRSMRHDWYVALSSEPVTIGSKTSYGLYFSVEYL